MWSILRPLNKFGGFKERSLIKDYGRVVLDARLAEIVFIASSPFLLPGEGPTLGKS